METHWIKYKVSSFEDHRIIIPVVLFIYKLFSISVFKKNGYTYLQMGFEHNSFIIKLQRKGSLK